MCVCARACVCVYVCVRVRACVRVCVGGCLGGWVGGCDVSASNIGYGRGDGGLWLLLVVKK